MWAWGAGVCDIPPTHLSHTLTFPPSLFAVWAWGGGVCDIPPQASVPILPEIRAGYRAHHDSPGQLLFYVRRGWGVATSLVGGHRQLGRSVGMRGGACWGGLGCSVTAWSNCFAGKRASPAEGSPYLKAVRQRHQDNQKACTPRPLELAQIPTLDPHPIRRYTQSPYQSAVRQRYQDNQKARKKNAELHSLRCDLQHKLQIAQCVGC